MLDWFRELVSGNALTYPIEAAFVAVDGFFPVVPGESVVITAAVFASGGELVVWLVLLAAALGAFAGDNVSYALGANVGRPAAGRLFRGDRSLKLLGWGRVQLRKRGLLVLVVARFIPGGRTATTFSAGMLDMPWRRFARADGTAVALWSAYVTALGYFGGATFSESLWKPLLISFGIATVVALVGELIRRLRTSGRDERSYREEGEQALGRGA